MPRPPDPNTNYSIHEAIVFLIEVSPEIFRPLRDLDNRSYIQTILNSINQLISELVINLFKTSVGIYLYNCNGEKLTELVQLKEINLDAMKKLNDLIDDDYNNRTKLESLFRPSSIAVKLPVILNNLIRKFQIKKFSSKKVFWFVVDDKSPYENDEDKISIRKILNDYNEFGVHLDFFFINDSLIKNYQDLFLLTKLDNNFQFNQLDSTINDKILRLKEITRMQFYLNIILYSGLKIPIRGYVFYNHEKLNRSISVYNKGEQLRLVHSKLTILNKTTGAPIENASDHQSKMETANLHGLSPEDKSPFRYGVDLGDEVFYFDRQQISDLKLLRAGEATPFLQIIGFRKLNKFKLQLNSNKTVFIAVNPEGNWTNAIKTFSALYQSLISLNRFAFCYGVVRRDQQPSMYALIPTNKSLNPDEDQFPQGFNLIRLPWKDDIRSVPEHVLKTCVVNKEREVNYSNDLTKDFVSLFKQFHLTAGYNPSTLKNPTINYFYKVLSDELLQREYRNNGDLDFKDDTLQKLIKIRDIMVNDDEKLSLVKQINGFLNSTANFNYIEQDLKKTKTEVRDLTDQDIINAWKLEQLNQYSVLELKKYISKYPAMKRTGKKSDLIDTIASYLEERTS